MDLLSKFLVVILHVQAEERKSSVSVYLVNNISDFNGFYRKMEDLKISHPVVLPVYSFTDLF